MAKGRGEAWGRAEVLRRCIHADLPDHTRKGKAEAVSAVAAEAGVSDDTVRRWAREARETGKTTRKVRADKGTSVILDDPERAAFLLAVVRTRGVCSDKLLYREVMPQWPGVTCSYATFHRAVEHCNQVLRGVDVYVPGPRVEYSTPLQRVEVDYSIGDFFVSDPQVNKGKPFRPVFGAIIDAATRCVMWASYTDRGGREVFGGMLYRAVLPKDDHGHWPCHGTPLSCGLDNGKEFKSEFGAEMLDGLGIARALARPHVPQDKGRVERWFGTAHRMLEDRLPGWCGGDNKGDSSVDPTKAFRFDGRHWTDPRPHIGVEGGRKLLTLAEANAALQAWIIGEYHHHEHEALGCSPLTAWLSGIMGVKERLNHCPELLAQVCLTFKAKRLVRRGGVSLMGLFFRADRLSDYEGMSVTVRYAPAECCGRVVVYTADGADPIACGVPADIMPHEEHTWRAHEVAKKEAARRRGGRKKALEGLTPAEAAELAPELERQAKGWDPVASPQGEQKKPWPERFKAWSLEEVRAELACEVYGIRLIQRHECPEELLAEYDEIWAPQNTGEMDVFYPPTEVKEEDEGPVTFAFTDGYAGPFGYPRMRDGSDDDQTPSFVPPVAPQEEEGIIPLHPVRRDVPEEEAEPPARAAAGGAR